MPSSSPHLEQIYSSCEVISQYLVDVMRCFPCTLVNKYDFFLSKEMGAIVPHIANTTKCNRSNQMDNMHTVDSHKLVQTHGLNIAIRPLLASALPAYLAFFATNIFLEKCHTFGNKISTV